MSDKPPHLYAEDIVVPIPASTVILVRDADDGGIEVYMTQRAKKLRFLGGYFVFPGGMLDDDDCSDEALALSDGLTPADAGCALNGGDTDPRKCLGYWIAGIRELFEEAGVLLGVDSEGKAPRIVEDATKALFEKHRLNLHGNKVLMTTIIKESGLRYAAGSMKYFSHWITPPGPPKRFDTRFFVAAMPEGQTASMLGGEVEAALWVKPEDAIKKVLEREWRMIPPTIISLRTISRHKSVAELFRNI